MLEPDGLTHHVVFPVEQFHGNILRNNDGIFVCQHLVRMALGQLVRENVEVLLACVLTCRPDVSIACRENESVKSGPYGRSQRGSVLNLGHFCSQCIRSSARCLDHRVPSVSLLVAFHDLVEAPVFFMELVHAQLIVHPQVDEQRGSKARRKAEEVDDERASEAFEASVDDE